MLIGLFYLIAREILQATNDFPRYITQKENWFEMLIVIFTIVYVVTMSLNKDISVHFGAWAVFMGWWELTMLLGRVPSIGIYIFLTTEVMKILFVYVLIYLPILISFACIFHLLLPSSESFNDIATSFIKILAMMVGEFDLGDNFLWTQSLQDNGQGSTQVAFVLFLLIGNIVIANLLVGLTVSKTEELFKIAGIYRLGKTVHQISSASQLFGRNSAFFKRRKTTQLFTFLKAKGGNWKICVMPHSLEQMKIDSKARQFLKGADSSSTSFENAFKTYLYDDLQGRGKELAFNIPAWVIAHTLTMLKNQKEIENEKIDSEAFKAYSMPIKTEKRPNQPLSQIEEEDQDEDLKEKIRIIQEKLNEVLDKIK